MATFGNDRKLLYAGEGMNSSVAVTEMFDGVRVYVDGGWFLIIPDASDPTVNVYAEGTSNDDADRLLAGVVQRIEALVTA